MFIWSRAFLSFMSCPKRRKIPGTKTVSRFVYLRNIPLYLMGTLWVVEIQLLCLCRILIANHDLFENWFISKILIFLFPFSIRESSKLTWNKNKILFEGRYATHGENIDCWWTKKDEWAEASDSTLRAAYRGPLVSLIACASVQKVPLAMEGSSFFRRLDLLRLKYICLFLCLTIFLNKKEVVGQDVTPNVETFDLLMPNVLPRKVSNIYSFIKPTSSINTVVGWTEN